MDVTSIELKVISCKDLKSFNLFRKLSAYAVVSLINDDEVKKNQEQQHLQRQKTPVDRVGDGNPEWNHVIHFDLKHISHRDHCNHFLLKFELRSEGIVFGNKTIGQVQVPLKDLIDEFNGAVRFISYQVRTCDSNKPTGVLNFSYKINGKTKRIAEASDKVHSPTTVEVQNQSRDIRYPSLEDVLSPSPPINIPSPKLNHWIPGSPSLTPHLAPTGYHGVPYHPYHPMPSIRIPGTYWYTPESMSYGYTLTPCVDTQGLDNWGRLKMMHPR
ncbi:protein SRC2-like [Castanea sativa]|uniref:protein SRC2-like n=1 Tax=Castanea sativa TaxID=21020 RepID=UPI003F654862